MELWNTGFQNAPYTTVLFTFHPNFASDYLIAVGNWNEAKRWAIRTVLHRARENFHRHPRPWWVHWLCTGMNAGLKLEFEDDSSMYPPVKGVLFCLPPPSCTCLDVHADVDILPLNVYCLVYPLPLARACMFMPMPIRSFLQHRCFSPRSHLEIIAGSNHTVPNIIIGPPSR